MRVSSIAAASLAWLSASASPLEKRQFSSNDIAVLQLAHFLENLEYNLYYGGYTSFSGAQYTAAGFPEGFRNSVGLIAGHENVHRTTLASVLESAGQNPPPKVHIQLPLLRPHKFRRPGQHGLNVSHFSHLQTPSSISTLTHNSVGVGAYIGGADLVMDNPTLLTAAGAILTIEARHVSIIRRGLGAVSSPAPFESYVTALWGYTLAHQFIVSCPVDLYPTALPTLKLAVPAPAPHLQPMLGAGTGLTFTWDPSTFFVSLAQDQPVYLVFINQVADPIFVPAGTASTGTATVGLPAGVAGAAFVVLSTFSGGLDVAQLSDFGTLAGPTLVLTG